jgi:hypothetical protein
VINAQPTNNDLIWDINALNYRDQAHEFILALENNLCVYSGSVEQLYSNYEILMPQEEDHKLVVLPNPYAYHDTYQHIPEEAVKATGLYIVPGEKGLLMVIPLKKGNQKFRSVPLNVGLKLINNHRSEAKPLMPVLMKGDLREFNAKIPTVHLHAINEVRLGHLSQLEIASIRDVVVKRMNALSSSHIKTSYSNIVCSIIYHPLTQFLLFQANDNSSAVCFPVNRNNIGA